MVTWMEVICGVIAVFLAIYYYLTSTYDFWKVRGVAGPRPVLGFGNMKDAMLLKKSMCTILKDVCKEFEDEPIIGMFARRNPVAIVRDPELIKDVLIRDFSMFADRGLPVLEKVDPLSQHLFNLESERWRPLRTRLSPVFTAGKLKEMFPLIIECSKHLEQYLDKLVSKGGPIECRELSAKFTTDVIGSCAFGIEINALSDEENEFRRMGAEVFKVSFWQLVRLRLAQILPKFYNLLGYVLPQRQVTKFFTKIIVDTMAYREENKIVRPDFVNMLLDLKRHPDKLERIKPTDTLLTAQAYVFFIAGFETSSSAMSHALYELALNMDVQDKLRREIKEYYKKNDGEVRCEDIKNLTYLDLVFRETMRKYPAGAILLRKSLADYTFRNTKVTIPAKTLVWIPLYPIHHDEKIYPNPDAFIPERFTEEAAATRHPMDYLAFGDGPRNCIGARFAVYQSKVGLITMLRKYKVEVCDQTMIPYEIHPGAFLLTPKKGIYLKFTKDES